MKIIVSTNKNGYMQKYLFSIFLFVLCSYLGFAQTITRTQIHNNAIPFTTYSFTTTSSNIQYNVNCSSVGNINTPSWITVGHNTVGMPYCWGGFSSESSFTTGIANGKSPGDNDCTTNGDCCESCALGVDCSGFVSRSWALTTKYSTTILPNICTVYSSASQVKQGDIFDLPGSHTRLVDTNYTNGNFLLMESSAVDWKVSYRSYTTSQLTSYTPMWYVHVDTAGTICTDNYATLPYSTSFENNWVTDSCNNGAQRISDVHWKGNIGGTSPDGDDYWHRNDYTGADWTSTTNGQYSPAASNGNYSARFHNDPPTAGSTGALDLYIDLSPAGTKTIKFDYFHNESSPSPFSFKVLLSTDGGNTFPTTLLTITTAQMSSWTTQTFTTSATSPTSVLRFIVSDKGTQDVGIDNLSITTTATGINELSDNTSFEIFPNPSDGTILDGSISETNNTTMAVHVYDMLGKEIINENVLIEGGNFSVPIAENKLSSGFYLFVGVMNNKRFTKKLVIR